ncbi:MAG: class I SAM-dependent methyltransferase [Propionibacteriaceae bacterium]|nr:class I SAM-dependent methyltransferase [Propionibacteriaceae bacterium]
MAEQFADPTGLGGRIVCAVMNRQNRPLYEATLGRLPADAVRVLDVGCGNGFVMGLLAQSRPSTVVGVDPSSQVIATAQRRYRGLVAEGRMEFAVGGADDTGQADGSLDAAYSVNTVYFWPDLAAGLAEIARVLKPGAAFINALYTPATLGRFSHTEHGYRKYEPPELVAAARAAGFGAEAVPLLGGKAFCVRCVKPTA